MDAVTLAACLSITAVAVGDVHSLLALGEEAMDRMEILGDVLLPAVSMATAAGGSPGAAAVKHGAAILFSDLLILLIRRLLIPLCCAFLACTAAWAALGNLMPVLLQHFRIEKQSVSADIDFTAEENTIYARAKLTITIGALLRIALHYGIRALIIYIKHTKHTKKGGGKHVTSSQ